jgi:carbon-monoxide dehydrogenase medium subunit
MREFDYYEPKSISEACNLLAADGARAIAGGTDLVVQMKHGAKKPDVIVNLKGLEELKGIRCSDDGVVIGSLVKISDIAESQKIFDGWRAVSLGADSVGTPQVRNLGTIGGNLCNSSPCADTVPGLLASDAVAVITNGRDEREIRLADFFTGPGKNCLAKGEILKEVRLPKMPDLTKQAFFKMGPRKAADIAVINMAISISREGSRYSRVRIAMGSVAPTPIMAKDAELAMENVGNGCDINKIADLAASAALPIDDVRGSAEYRRQMLKVAARRLLRELCK